MNEQLPMTPPPDLLPRRDLLRAAAAAFVSGRFLPTALAGIGDKYADVASEHFLGPVEIVTRITDAQVFTEGPAVDLAGRVYFTNVPMSKILVWDPDRQELSVFRQNAHQSNGLCFDRQGRLLACEGGSGRVTRTDLNSGRLEVLAENFRGRKLAAPNDICIDGKGRIFFTSRSGVRDLPDENGKSVYRIDHDGTLTQLLTWPEVHMPNGIVTTPDDRTLYLIDAHPDAEHYRNLRAFDLQADGSLTNPRVLVDFYPGRSGDGMAIDAEGNLYVAAGLHAPRGTSETLETRPGIHVFSPSGQLMAFRQTPEDTVTNCTFGGPDLKTLFVTCGTLLLSIPTKVSGKDDYRPQG
jgi:gluconolactonase